MPIGVPIRYNTRGGWNARRNVICVVLLVCGMASVGWGKLTPLSGDAMPDPFISRDASNWYITGTKRYLLQGKSLTRDALKQVGMRLDLGPRARQMWSFSLYKHTDGSYHAYPSLNYGNWKTEVAHLVPADGEKWTDGHPITRWRLDKVMVGDSKHGRGAYDGKVIRDIDGTLYIIYVQSEPGDRNSCIWAQRMLNPGTLDPSFAPRILIRPEGYPSEDRNPGYIQLMEGANFTRIAGKWVMCYSVGDFALDNYKLAVAFSDTLIPPEGKYYRKVLTPDPKNLWGNPRPGKEDKYLLQSQKPDWPNYCRKLVAGPGVGSIVNVDGKYRLVFHGWMPETDNAKRKGAQRYMWMIPLEVNLSSKTPMDQWIRPILPK